MRLIDADTVVHWQSYDDEHETFPEHEGTIAEFLDSMTDEGCPGVVDAVPVVRKPVKGYEGYYEVDCFGRVYSLDRTVSVNDNGRMYDKPVVGRVMGQTVKPNGYKCVSLTKDGESKAFYVHRLVADAFIPNPDDLPMVNHKDEDKSNNFVENLEWCTNEYNINYGTGKERRAKKIRGRVSPHAVQIEAFGECHTRKEWGDMYRIDPKSIARRMSRGWSAEKAISTPLMKNQYAFERKDGEAHGTK